MIRVGSSMTTEAWDEYFKPNLTWNHAWGSAPANITARKLMGIEPIEPTYRTFRICPQPGNLERASIKLPCIRGTIACDLKNRESNWEMKVSVPGNSEAEIWLPAKYPEVSVNGDWKQAVRTENFADGKRNVVILKSGIYMIAAKK
jgi:hypothetical protein